MISLTKLWGDFQYVDVGNSPTVTRRLFMQRLSDPDCRERDLFIALNSLSGSIDILSEPEGVALELLRGGLTTHLDSAMQRELSKRGYIFPSRAVEEQVYAETLRRAIDARFTDDQILPFFSFDTTCGMACEYCFQKRGEESKLDLEVSRMDEESLRSAFRALDNIQEYYGKTSKWAVGFGGEPLKGNLTEINTLFMSLAHERGIPITYFSNLAMTSQELRDVLKKNAGQLHFIETTLDGPPAVHNALRMLDEPFQRTERTITELLKAGVPITVRTNVNQENLAGIPELAEAFERNGWFGLPNFKSVVSRITDRHHDGSKIFREDDAMSAWLALKDRYPVVRKMNDYNIAYGLFNLMLALGMRSVVDKVDFRVDTSPVVRHCPTDTGLEFVFTGKPHNGIYTCAECAGMPKYRIGTHFPDLVIDPAQASKWGNATYIGLRRDILSLEPCWDCIGATQCGGDCSLEAIAEYGSASKVYCKDVPSVIKRFLEHEQGRIYLRCRELIKESEEYDRLT